VIDELRPAPGVRVPVQEIVIRASRSSGPGGQHANVTASRIEVAFDVQASGALSEEQKRRVVAREGPVLRAVAQEARSQARNRELALRRLEERLARALAIPRVRKATAPSKAARRRRLDAKSRRAAVKRDRRPPSGEWRRCRRL
jgi:ribosome-associated protein